MRVANTKGRAQDGIALLLCLFALLLLSGIGIFLYMSSATETRISTNYGSKLGSYYAAKSGLQEVRDRVTYASAPNPPAGGLADRLPKDIAGNTGGVLYIVNPSGGETVNPTDPSNRYFDDELCHDYNSGVAPGTKCDMTPGTANWYLPQQTSLSPAGTLSPLKWVRINMKTDRAVAPNYCVDQTCANLDAPVCWDGKTEQLSPGGALPACDANGMQNVYMLTALAVTPGLRENSARTLLRSEVVAPSIRPPGAITMDAAGSTPTLSDGKDIPSTVVDGRSHNMDGSLTTNGRCSAVAALATDNATSTAQLQQELDAIRKNIVNTANNSCKADGSDNNGNHCTPGLWWVRGTGSSFRFVTSTSGSSSGGSGSPDGDGQLSSGSGSSTTCDSSTANCYTYLNLASPELLAVSASYGSPIPVVTLPGNLPVDQAPALFTGGPGNQTTGSIYQSSMTATLPNEVALVSALVAAAASQGQANYFAVSSANLASNYGTSSDPKIVTITDSSLVLQNRSLSGYGVLVVPNNLEIDSGGSLQWTGIVLVQSGSLLPPQSGSGAQFKITAGGQGFIRGALLLQPGTATAPGSTSSSLISTTASTTSGMLPAFQISYSCDAIDMAFNSLPFKIIGSSEISF